MFNNNNIALNDQILFKFNFYSFVNGQISFKLK